MKKNIAKALVVSSALISPLVSSQTVNASTQTYILNNDVKGYYNASDAIKKINPTTTYKKGQYYIYKTYNGMINISRSENFPGVWINPSDNKIATTTTTSSKSGEGKYVLTKDINTYNTALNAKLETSPSGVYKAGEYYIYRTYDGMLNISKIKGVPGGWINPNAKVSVRNTETKIQEKKVSTPAPKVSTYTLVADVSGYKNVSDASSMKNPIVKYKAGSYYIYRKYNGLLNIAKKQGKIGVWINPKENVKTNPATKPSTTATKTKLRPLYQYRIYNEMKGYNSTTDAVARKNAVKTFKPGVYYVFKNHSGAMNISDKEHELGHWINPKDNIIPRVEEKVIVKTHVVKDYIDAFKTRKGAADRVRPDTILSPGVYFVNSANGNILNISIKQGGESYFINTSTNKTPVVKHPIESDIKQGTSYVIKSTVKTFASPENALYLRNATGKLNEGLFTIHEYKYDMLKLKDKAGRYYWINPSENRYDIDNGNWQKAKPEEFINKVGPIAKRLAKENDLYASVMIAQAILESGYGTTHLANHGNNLFGIKGYHNGNALAIHTFEYKKDGSKYSVIAPFKKFNNIEDSLRGYVQTLTGGGDKSSWRYNYYKGAHFSNAKTYRDATKHLTGRYATSPTYNVSLNNLIEKFNLTRFDQAK